MAKGEATKQKPWIDVQGTAECGFLKGLNLQGIFELSNHWRSNEAYLWIGEGSNELWLPGFKEPILADWIYPGKGIATYNKIYDNCDTRSNSHNSDCLAKVLQTYKGSLKLYHFFLGQIEQVVKVYEALMLYSACQQGWNFRERGKSFLGLPKSAINCQKSKMPLEAIEDFFDLTKYPDLRNYIIKQNASNKKR